MRTATIEELARRSVRRDNYRLAPVVMVIRRARGEAFDRYTLSVWLNHDVEARGFASFNAVAKASAVSRSFFMHNCISLFDTTCLHHEKDDVAQHQNAAP